MSDLPLSVLELALVESGRTAAEALAPLAGIGQRLDELGYRRLWFAEHHGSPAIASASPQVLASHVAAVTSRLRIGSGGVLAPNHAPFVLAEQFATLSALSGGRADLGIGRGPGAVDPELLRTLRRGAEPADEAEYHSDLDDLLRYLGRDTKLRVLPGEVVAPEPWLLSSSPAGAALAGERGLPLAFAHHIRPDNTAASLARYREAFRPSPWRSRPHVLLAVETVCADTDAQAQHLVGPMNVLKSGILTTGGQDTELLSPDQAAAHEFTPEMAEQLGHFRAAQAHGDPEYVAGRLSELAEQTAADELMIVTPVYDAAARLHSYELVAGF
ncbi:LLM class flavin-dependent oxidoreductase [Amycolatopsis jiangsuensis]|uniref:Luciferase family oxidoreductase group 1 n=1 Tax=Amycolatopsis jiangsuensis TaxID=1181879 RepID=A0A840IST2_9PSEU|nr:LLM class flavin-dependent oxidoreductase [Amycolatopsis jiangsuensis]MBB4684599.1 luciferase family oxidoreductase group 1 [Amycolatopsis jiangsuensis]